MKQPHGRSGRAVSSFHPDRNQSDHNGAGTHTFETLRRLTNFGLLTDHNYKGHYGFNTSDYFFDVTRSHDDKALRQRKPGNVSDAEHFEIQGLGHDNHMRFTKGGLPLSPAILGTEGVAKIQEMDFVPGFGMVGHNSDDPRALRFSPGHFVEDAVILIGQGARDDAWFLKQRAEGKAVNGFLDAAYEPLRQVYDAQEDFRASYSSTVDGRGRYDQVAVERLTVGAMALHDIYLEQIGVQEPQSEEPAVAA